MLTPLTRYRLREPGRLWGIDNGAFSQFDEKAFTALLARESGRDKSNCKFVCAPDVVASAQRTREVFDLWEPRLKGWPVALVCQDGQENVEIPWPRLAAVFIGGSTEWKESEHVQRIIKVAKDYFGKWVHVGRVNDPKRYDLFAEWGADSCDGSGLAQYSHMREAIAKRKDKKGMLW